MFFFFQAKDGVRGFCLSRGLGDVYKRQLLRFIRMESSQSHVPVLMVTTEGDAGKLAAIQQDGVSAIMNKPFEPTEVKRIIEASLSA